MSQQDIWDLWAAIEDIREKAKAQQEEHAAAIEEVRRLCGDLRKAIEREREGRDKAEQQLREEAATLIQLLDDACRAKIDELAAQSSRQDTRAETRDRFEDEVRQLLGLGPRADG